MATYDKDSGKRETLNSGLSVHPDLDHYNQVNGDTHFDIRIENRSDGWAVTGRIRGDWRQRVGF